MTDLVETDIGYVPKSWAVRPLCELFISQLGKMLSQKARGGISPKQYLRNHRTSSGVESTSQTWPKWISTPAKGISSDFTPVISLSAKAASQGARRNLAR